MCCLEKRQDPSPYIKTARWCHSYRLLSPTLFSGLRKLLVLALSRGREQAAVPRKGRSLHTLILYLFWRAHFIKDHLPEWLRGQTRIEFLPICYALRAQVQILQWSNLFAFCLPVQLTFFFFSAISPSPWRPASATVAPGEGSRDATAISPQLVVESLETVRT